MVKISQALSIQLMTARLKESQGISVSDIGLWSIQRDLIRECGLYDAYFVQTVSFLPSQIKKFLLTFFRYLDRSFTKALREVAIVLNA